MDGGAWWAAVHAKGRTRLSDFTFTFHFPALEKEMATHSSVLAWRIPGTGGAWWAAVYEVTRSRTRLKWLSSSSSVFLCIYKILIEVWFTVMKFKYPWNKHAKPGRRIEVHVFKQKCIKQDVSRDFPSGPVVKNLPCNAGYVGLIPGQESKIPLAQSN